MEICTQVAPNLIAQNMTIGAQHLAACHLLTGTRMENS
jgi:hypothetical protein